MILSKYPADFASAYKENPFSFTEVDPTFATDVEFYDEEGDVVGVRRYVGRERIDSSPCVFALSRLAPAPIVGLGECGFVRPSGRDVSLVVTYNDSEDETPAILFTASRHNQSANSTMGGAEQWRSIASGESDEVSFCLTMGSRIEAQLLCDDAVIASLGEYTSPSKGVVLFVVDADDILSRLPHPESVALFDIAFAIDGRECARIHYKLRPSFAEDVRLGWLSGDGYIAYHTFPRPIEHHLHTQRTLLDIPEGSVAESIEAWEEMELRSGVLCSSEMTQLADLLSATRLWRIRDGVYEPYIILSHEAQLGGDGAKRVTLTIRPAQKKRSF